MGNVKKENEALSAREKGDIYWQKLKYYLQSEKEKEKNNDQSRSGFNIAKEILEKSSEDITKEVEKEGVHITGNEFSKRPPTATGERAYKENIIYAVRIYELLVKYVSSDSKDNPDEVINEYVDKLVPVMENAVNTWFLANGIDYETKEKAESGLVHEAKEKLDKAISAYEDAVSGFRRFVSKTIVKELKKDFAETKVEYVSAEKEFAEMFSQYADNYKKNKKMIDRACLELNVLRKKTAEFSGDVKNLTELLDSTDQYRLVNQFMTFKDVILEYIMYIFEQTSAATWAEDGCECLIKYLLAGEKADPMVANYIYAHFNVEVATYPLYEKVRDLPEYVGIDEEDDNTEYSFSNFDDLQKAMQEVIDYLIKNKRQFYCQSITSMLFHSRDLIKVENKARAIRNHVVTAFKAGEFEGLSVGALRDLKSAWITADAVTRVATMIVEYVKNSEKRTLSDLIASYAEDTAEMEYAVQERESREYLEVLIRRTKEEHDV